MERELALDLLVLLQDQFPQCPLGDNHPLGINPFDGRQTGRPESCNYAVVLEQAHDDTAMFGKRRVFWRRFVQEIDPAYMRL